MAAYISFQPSDFFSPLLFTGNGTSQALTGLGFQPDSVMIRSRAGNSFPAFNPLQGVTKYVALDATSAEQTSATTLTSFDSDGFTLGGNSWTNANAVDYVSYGFKMGTTSGLSGGTITPSAYSINTTSKCGVYLYSGNSTSGGTIAHGLGGTPTMIWIKSLNGTYEWAAYMKKAGNTKAFYLNTNQGLQTNSGFWNDTSPNDTTWTMGTSSVTNGSFNYVAYVFCDVPGYSQGGAYAGNGNDNGTFVYTGFRPAALIVKRDSNSVPWFLWDDKRLGYNDKNYQINIDSTGAEGTDTYVDLLSNGFKLNTSNADINYDMSSSEIYYYAFAEFPFVSSNSKAGTAR